MEPGIQDSKDGVETPGLTDSWAWGHGPVPELAFSFIQLEYSNNLNYLTELLSVFKPMEVSDKNTKEPLHIKCQTYNSGA